MRWSKLLGLAFWLSPVRSLASTDSIQNVDPPQSGYLPNHNIDPNAISSLKISFQNTYNTNEVFYAKPLVYTPSGHASELVITVSNQNNVRIIDGLTGSLINSRTLDAPFASVDTSCGDIPNTVGITGTPIIDPNTDTLYFFSKGYKNGAAGPQGTINGQYKFYALSIPSLQDIQGFPVVIDGHAANNDATRYFVGGTVLQRPGLAAVGNIIVGGFGGHCDNFNYTGMLVAVSKTAGVGVTNVIAMEAQPGAPSPQALDITVQGGGKAGIWQSGMGIATDGNRVFFATGNGRGAGDNGKGVPASGKVPISTLEQVVANFAVDPSSGVLTQSDYFEPYEYDSLNGGDRDFGSSGVALLDPGTFNGNGINRLAMAGGKSGKVYVMNADNLGGYANGPGNQDAVIQTIVNGNSLFSGIGSYPLEGGYIYYNPTGDLLYCYKFGHDGSGNPLFTLAGKSASTFAGKSVPTITSLNGQAGTGIVWLADGNQGLTAFNAVPVNGVLQPITVPQTGGLTKFQRPAFGNGRIYVTHANSLIAVGGASSPSSTSKTSSASSTSTSSQTSSSRSTTSSTSSTSSSSQTSSSSSTTSSTSSISTSSQTSSSSSTTSSTSSSSQTSSSSSTTSSTSSISTSSQTSSSSSTTSSTSSTSSSSSTSLSSSASSTSTGPSSNTATTTTSSGTTSGTSITTTPTGSSTYQYIGCFQDTSSGHALPLLFANNSMTPELCGAYVQSLANAPTPTMLPYYYLEYHRECYGGSVFNFGSSSVSSLTGANACTDVCSGSIGAATTGTAKCGGAKQFNLYAKDGVVAWQGQTTTYSISRSSISSTTSSSSASSSSSLSTLSTTTSTTSSSTSTGPSSNTATVTTSQITTFVTSTTSTSTATQAAYQHIGCFKDSGIGHAMPLLFANNSMTPELCAAYVQSLAQKQPTSTILPYFYLEYHRECYGGSVFNYGSSTVTSVANLATASGCTDVCSGSVGATTTGTAKCGGPNQFDLYTITPTASSSTTSSTSATSSSASATSSATVSYNWNIGWVSASPDGVQRPFVGVNGQWPCPALNVNVGDIVQLNIYNSLGNETTAIHFHGLHQRGTNQMDGPAMVTQCSIPPGESFTYQFQINQTGTYWYHAHIGGQYMDGFRGPLIVHDSASPYQVDQEIVLTLSDLYHDQAPYLINYYQSPANENLNAGAEPVPNATLINEAQNVKFNIVPGKTYLFRIINMGVFASQWLQFDQHDMTVVETDGVYTQPYNVSQLFITVAQRYSVIVKAKADNSQNYAIVASMMTDMFNPSVTPPNLVTTVTSWLVYDPTKPLPSPFTLQPQTFNDALFLPYDQQPILGPVTYSLTLTADFGPNNNNQQRANFNGISYVPQKVPTLYTAMSAPANVVNNPAIYGTNSNPSVIPYGAVVELYISNHDSNAHPFHLHGHQFQVVDRSGGGLLFPGFTTPDPPIPMRRDVVIVPGGGYAVIRFVADNPGVTLFHCHIEWHVEAGLTATFIEAPDKLQAMNLVLPDSHKAVCAKQGILMSGNAAGNSNDWLNLTGANTNPPLNAWGALVNPPS